VRQAQNINTKKRKYYEKIDFTNINATPDNYNLYSGHINRPSKQRRSE